MSQNKIMFMSIYITNMQAGIFFMNTPTQYYRKYVQGAIYTFFFGSWSLSNSRVDSDTLLILLLLNTIEEPDGRSMSFEWIKKDKHEKFIEIRRGREPNTGYDDRFQIQKRKDD